MCDEMKEVLIHTEYITLGQAMKLCGEAHSGIEAKIMIQEGHVLVNGEVDRRRGKKLRDGDVFEVDRRQYVIHGNQNA